VRLNVLLLGCCLAVIAAAAPPTRAQPATVDRPAEVRGGTCDSLGEVVATLAHLVVTVGDPRGQLAATPVEQSGTVVPFAVADFLDSNHAVVVQQSPQESAVVACGEVGGALNPDGTLAVGMRGMNGSSLSGVAYFTPIDTFANSLVTILLFDSNSTTTTAVDGDTGLDNPSMNPQ
jgi:hypothetical protein